MKGKVNRTYQTKTVITFHLISLCTIFLFIIIFYYLEIRSMESNELNYALLDKLKGEIIFLEIPFFIVTSGLIYFVTNQFFSENISRFKKLYELGIPTNEIMRKIMIKILFQEFLCSGCGLGLVYLFVPISPYGQIILERCYENILIVTLILTILNISIIYFQTSKNWKNYILKLEDDFDADWELTEFHEGKKTKNKKRKIILSTAYLLIPILTSTFLSIFGLPTINFEIVYMLLIFTSITLIWLLPIYLAIFLYPYIIKLARITFQKILSIKSKHSLTNYYNKIYFLIQNRPVIKKSYSILIMFTVSFAGLCSTLYTTRINQAEELMQLNWDQADIKMSMDLQLFPQNGDLFQQEILNQEFVETFYIQNHGSLLEKAPISGFYEYKAIQIDPLKYIQFIDSSNININAKPSDCDDIEAVFQKLLVENNSIIVSNAFAKSKGVKIYDEIELYVGGSEVLKESFKVIAILDNAPLLNLDDNSATEFSQIIFSMHDNNSLFEIYKIDLYMKTNTMIGFNFTETAFFTEYSNLIGRIEYPPTSYLTDESSFLERFLQNQILLFIPLLFIFLYYMKTDILKERTIEKKKLVQIGMEQEQISKRIFFEIGTYLLILIPIAIFISILTSYFLYNTLQLTILLDVNLSNYSGWDELLTKFETTPGNNVIYYGKYITIPFDVSFQVLILPFLSIIYFAILYLRMKKKNE